MIVAKAQPTTLEAPLAAGDTTFTLSELVDSKGNPLALASFGSWVVVVLVQGGSTEMIKCSAIVQNADGSAALTVASNGRNIDPTTPYAGYSTGLDFQAGAVAIITNDPLTMSRFANFDIAGTFAQLMNFTVTPGSQGGNPVNPTDLVIKSYVDALVLGSLTTLDIVVPGTAEVTIAKGQLIYFDTVTGGWKLASSAAAATVQDVLLGIAQGAGTASNPIVGGVLLQGTDGNQTGLTPSTLYYANDTAGSIGTSAGTVSVVVGIAKDATHLMFAPNFNIQLTKNQSDALAGTSGTTPSSSNKFVDNADTANTSANGKVIRANGSGKIDTSFLPSAFTKFGGTGTDGALSITSGTTSISAGGLGYLEKNYTSVSITGTGNLAVTSPNNSSGTSFVMRSQGNVTITTSSTHAIDMRLCGGGTGNAQLFADNGGSSSANGVGGSGGGSTAGGGSQGGTNLPTGSGAAFTYGISIAGNALPPLSAFVRYAPPGGNGSNGSSSGSNGFSAAGGGAGGIGGGGLYIECGGAYNFTTGAIDCSGHAGSTGASGGGGSCTSGCGGGGAGGNVVVLYATLTADSGTYNVAAGAGGSGTGASGAAGAAGTTYRGFNNYFN